MNTVKLSKKLTLCLFSLIITIGVLTRVVGLSKNPYGFFCDEASIGYNAYTILKYGTDEYGTPFPVFFKAFGEYKSPVNIYSAVPFVAALGLNEYSVRLFAATYGVLTLVVFYFLTKVLFNKKVALIAMLFLAISPWHIHISRIAFENVSYLFWLTLSVLLFLYGLRNRLFLIFAALSFGVTVYTYTPARIVAPMFFAFLILLYNRALIGKTTRLFSAISISIFAILLIPLSLALINGSALSRWNQLTVISLGLSTKDTAKHIVTAYFNYFSPTFLFTKGDIDFPKQYLTRHSVAGMGELYLFQLPLLLIGVFYLTKNYKKLKFQNLILLFWLIIYPASAALTTDASPFATRGLIGIIPFSTISAVGLYQLFNYIKNIPATFKKTVLFCSYLIITLSFVKYVTLLINYPKYSADYWGFQSGPKEIVKYFVKNKNKYDYMCMEGVFNEPQIFIKFYDYNNLCNEKCGVCSPLDDSNHQGNVLYAISFDSYLKYSSIKRVGIDYEIEKIIYYPNGTPAFYLIRQ